MAKRWKVRPEGSTWGDFGEDDQVGRLNLITEERRLAAVGEVKVGKVFVLSLPLDYPRGKIFPFRHPPKLSAELRGSGHNYNYRLEEVDPRFLDVVSDDAVLMYTQYSTQWDSLAHLGQQFDADGDGKPENVYYNGFRAGEEIIGPEDPRGMGARALGVENMAMTGVQGRGVIVDLHAAFGRKRECVDFAALEAVMRRDHVEVGTGDILCLYTGLGDVILEAHTNVDPAVFADSCAVLDGRDRRLRDWIRDVGVAAIVSDNVAVEAYPARASDAPRHAALPLHEHCLFRLGMNLGELWYLTELNTWLKANGRSRFLLTAPPLRLPGAVGSPATPVATV